MYLSITERRIPSGVATYKTPETAHNTVFQGFFITLNQVKITNVNGDNYTANYVYDSRGNITSKTVNNETTSFTYANFGWKDLLIAVNDVELTYDEVGNVLTYGDKEFTWNSGRNLESIVDSDNNYSYTYDENGIRASKTVNGRSIQYNVLGSKILAEDGVNGEIYFQYSGDELIGFYLNDVQYFYIKNLNGDIVGITDYDGNLIAQYEYDEWGKLLNITTAEEGNEEQLRIANANPFRYRGYYYDNETGYYYLQSRYYNPEWGRFISADDLNYINNSKSVNLNAYCYCANNPIMRSDPTGKAWVSDLGVQIAEIISVIMATWDAFVQGGKDFAALIAAQLTLDTSLLYQPGKNHIEQHLNFEKWMDDMFAKFMQFTETSFYKVVKFFNDNFFIDFVIDSIKEKAYVFKTNITSSLQAFFGIGNADSLYSTLKDLFEGRLEIFSKNNLSSGLILKFKEIGIYFQGVFDKFENFYYGFVLDLTIDLPDFNGFNTPDFPLGVTDFNMNSIYVAPVATAAPYIIYALFLVLGIGAGIVLV